MINCVIIDDEKPARDSLELMLGHYFHDKVRIIGKAESLKEGILLIYKHNPDLVFLDIEMPEENGFMLFNYFQQVKFSVIFTTAYKEYAIKAIKVAALDYLLKPISVEDLREAISLYEKRLFSGIEKESIEKLIGVLNPSTNVEKIALPTFYGFQMEKTGDIIYFEADENYTKVHTISGKVLLVSRSIGDLEKTISPNTFFRIHRSYIVNLNFVKAFNRNDGYFVTMENGAKLDVAARRKDDLIKTLTGH